MWFFSFQTKVKTFFLDIIYKQFNLFVVRMKVSFKVFLLREFKDAVHFKNSGPVSCYFWLWKKIVL